jgi:internalin A
VSLDPSGANPFYETAVYWIERAVREGMGGLDLTNHRLNHLPERIADAKNLEILAIDRNAFTAIPSVLGSLPRLRFLSALNNPLQDVPKEIGNLSDSAVIRIDTSQLPATMAAAYHAGVPAFLAYLRSLSDAAPHYEAKVILIGDGNAGKTTCLERLVTGKFIARPTTHGVEVKTLSVPHPDATVREAIQLNCWDFGGQDIYRITHQFFYSGNAIYILVWNPRDKARRQGLEMWLEGIRLRIGSSARVIIVSTHSDEDERGYRVDYGGLRQDFADIIVDVMEIDSRTGRGIECLRSKIAFEASHLPHVGEAINTKWKAVRTDLLRRVPQLSFESYTAIRSLHGVREDEQEALLVWLNATGRILYYATDFYLKNFIVTDPEWLTKAVGAIVSDRVTLERNGELDHERLRELWPTESHYGMPSYNIGHYPYLLRITERFDVTYIIPERENLSLVGELVPELPPANLHQEWNQAEDYPGQQLSLICQIPTVLPGLMERLIVRTHRFTTKRHWTRGVLLRHVTQNAFALVELTRSTELHLTVRSPESPVSFFEVIREIIVSVINDHYRDIVPLFLIPCRGHDGSKRCSGLFQLQHVERARMKRVSKIQCQACLEEQHVSELLTGFRPSEDDVLRAVRRIEAQVSLASDQAIVMREVLRQLSDLHEQSDCPRIFRLEPIDVSAWRPAHWLEHSYRLTLYCEHPEHEHPWDDASYTISGSQDWLRKVAPYIGYIGKAVRYGVPIIGSGVGIFLGDAAAIGSGDADFASKIAAISPTKVETQQKGYLPPPRGTERLDGAAFFEFRHMLMRLTSDRSPKFGGLRRVRDPAGRYLWVCPPHDAEIYNPPLLELHADQTTHRPDHVRGEE